MKNAVEQVLFNVKDAAALFGVAPSTFRHWYQRAEIPQPYVIAGKKYWRKDELEQYIQIKRKGEQV